MTMYHLKAFCTTVETSFMNCSSVLLSADFWGVVEVPGEQGSSLPYNFFDHFLLLGVSYPSDMTALTIISKYLVAKRSFRGTGMQGLKEVLICTWGKLKVSMQILAVKIALVTRPAGEGSKEVEVRLPRWMYRRIDSTTDPSSAPSSRRSNWNNNWIVNHSGILPFSLLLFAGNRVMQFGALSNHRFNLYLNDVDKDMWV